MAGAQRQALATDIAVLHKGVTLLTVTVLRMPLHMMTLLHKMCVGTGGMWPLLMFMMMLMAVMVVTAAAGVAVLVMVVMVVMLMTTATGVAMFVMVAVMMLIIL